MSGQVNQHRHAGWHLAAAFVAGALLVGFAAILLARGLFFPTEFYEWGLADLETATVAVAGLALALAGLATGAIRAVRARSWKPATQSLLFALGIAAGSVPAYMGALKVRDWGLEQFARRSDVLIAAIRTYERDAGAPPSSLTALVPSYLALVPRTGVPAYSAYLYQDSAGPCLPGNNWHLAAKTPELGEGSCLVFCPDQNYADIGRANNIHADWAVIDLFVELPDGARARLPYCLGD